MLRAIRQFIEQIGASPSGPVDTEDAVRLATAVLLVEVMHADTAIDSNERAAAAALLGTTFQLGPDEVQELLALAQEKSRLANDFFAFTSVLNDRLSQAQKIGVVEQMWRIALVDASADAGETHVISKVAGLLHVTHGEYIAAKLRARQAAGGAQ
jgi:uncharacterized tellurite resistance protein B-like protein